VVPGEVYRSAQLDAGTLGRLIDSKGIRTVLNLRGPNPEADWYQTERAAVLEAGATLIDLPMASDYWLTPSQARTVLETLERCERPVLIHCQFGSERTGLVSAMAMLSRPDGSLEAAEAQFSPYYLFLPLKDGLVMRGHFDRYQAWLESQGLEHEPRWFRRWLSEAYEPGSPNRSQWPYDPYPLKVVTRPNARPVR